jgi:hypothetical protein
LQVAQVVPESLRLWSEVGPALQVLGASGSVDHDLGGGVDVAKIIRGKFDVDRSDVLLEPAPAFVPGRLVPRS